MPERSYCTLLRVDPETEAETEIGQHGWDGENPIGPIPLDTWQECNAPPPHNDICLEEPESCVDCDGDGTAECADWCIEWGTFESVDDCVPVAPRGSTKEYTYSVTDCFLGSQFEPVDVESVTVLVTQVDDCQLGSTNGCSCSSNPFPPTVPWLLSAVLFVIGFVSLAVAKGRRT